MIEPLETTKLGYLQPKSACPFCQTENIGKSLFEHTMNCDAYEKILDDSTCPLCQNEVKSSMTIHLFEHIKDIQAGTFKLGKYLLIN